MKPKAPRPASARGFAQPSHVSEAQQRLVGRDLGCGDSPGALEQARWTSFWATQEAVWE